MTKPDDSIVGGLPRRESYRLTRFGFVTENGLPPCLDSVFDFPRLGVSSRDGAFHKADSREMQLHVLGMPIVACEFPLKIKNVNAASGHTSGIESKCHFARLHFA